MYWGSLYYTLQDTNKSLFKAAEVNVLHHLEKLKKEDIVGKTSQFNKVVSHFYSLDKIVISDTTVKWKKKSAKL